MSPITSRDVFRLLPIAAIVFLAAACSSSSSLSSDINKIDSMGKETPEQKAQQIEPMLSAAGFVMLPADTEKRQQQLENLPPLKVSYYVGRTGKLHYWMADPKYCKCMYLGSEQAYQRYEQMRLQAKWQQQENETARTDLEAEQEQAMDAQIEEFNPYGGMGWVGPGFYYP
ncbi:MAG TPA: hypothetical protein VMH37_18045 [Candidatus Binataceae bacterium]|nr:hypothetical protein [Candidatus Binataceae bacterium]